MLRRRPSPKKVSIQLPHTTEAALRAIMAETGSGISQAVCWAVDAALGRVPPLQDPTQQRALQAIDDANAAAQEAYDKALADRRASFGGKL